MISVVCEVWQYDRDDGCNSAVSDVCGVGCDSMTGMAVLPLQPVMSDVLQSGGSRCGVGRGRRHRHTQADSITAHSTDDTAANRTSGGTTALRSIGRGAALQRWYRSQVPGLGTSSSSDSTFISAVASVISIEASKLQLI